MSGETTLAVLIALVPVAIIWALLDWANRAGVRREEAIGRQIALTDALHRELGAVVAPVVAGSASRGWTVSVRVPLDGESEAVERATGEPLIGSIARITHELFRRLDDQESPRIRLVLIARPAPRPLRPAAPRSTRVPAELGRAA